MAKKDRRTQKKLAAGNLAGRAGGLKLPAWLGADQGPAHWILVVCALLVVLAVTYPGPMFQKLVFPSPDSSNADAFHAVGDASLAEGHYPHWNPYIFAGMPSFGSMTYARFIYPPSVVFNFLQTKLAFPPMTWALAHLLFGGLGMAWLLSRWRLPAGLLVLGAVAFILFPKVTAWVVHGHGSKLGAAMYLPWVVGLALRILDGKGWRSVGWLGLLMGLEFLRGHPQITFYILMTVGWVSLWGTLFPLDEAARRLRPATRWLRLGQVGVGIVLGFMVGAVLLLPLHDYSKISIRGQAAAGGGATLEYATGWSLAPAELGTLVLPAAAGFGKSTYVGFMPFNDYPNYLGLLLLGLAAGAWWHGRRSLTIGLMVLVVLAVFISFGNFGFGLYELLYNYLPFFNKFRIPSMILVLVGFVVALLAARGAGAWQQALQQDDAQQGPAPFGRPLVLPAVLGALGLIMLLAGAAGLGKGAYLSGLQDMAASSGKQAVDVILEKSWFLHKSSLIRMGLVLLTAGAALWAAHRNRRFLVPQLPWILAVLVVLDLGGVNRLIIHPEYGLQSVARGPDGRGTLVTAQPLLRPAPEARVIDAGPTGEMVRDACGHDRVWPLGNVPEAFLWMTDGVRSLAGYHPAKLARYEQIYKRLYANPLGGRLASWLAGSVVAVNGQLGPADLEYLQQAGIQVQAQPLGQSGVYLYRNESALPRARLLDSYQLVAQLPEKDALAPFLDGIQAGTLDVTGTVYLAEEPDPRPVPAAAPLPAPVFVKDGLDEVVLQTDAPTAALLLLADMNAPGWRVQVDGAPARLLTADLVLRGVALEAGSHTVRFHYTDPSVRRGLSLTVAGALVILLLLVLPWLRRGLSGRGKSTPVEGSHAHE